MTIVRDKLTVLLPLKGREEFTKRWLTYHSEIGLDCKILIGDGDPDSRVTGIIDDFKPSLKLDFSYKRYNDSDLTKFYEKLLSLVEAANTKYVMLTDNDDFVLPTGLVRAIEFLESSPDYVSCGGANLGVYGAPRGLDISKFPAAFNEEWLSLGIIYSSVSVDHEHAEERVTATRQHYQPTWYCVHKKDCLRDCLRAILDYGIKDVYVMELFQALFMAAKGKVRQDYQQAVYVRQLNSSVCAAGANNDIFSRMFNGTMVDDYQHLWDAIAKVVADCDGKDVQCARKTISDLCIARERSDAIAPITYGNKFAMWLSAWKHSFRAKLPLCHSLMQRAEVRKVLDTIRKTLPHDSTYPTVLRTELHAVFNSMKSPKIRLEPSIQAKTKKS